MLTVLLLIWAVGLVSLCALAWYELTRQSRGRRS